LGDVSGEFHSGLSPAEWPEGNPVTKRQGIFNQLL